MENWTLNRMTAQATHKSGLRCGLSNDTIHKGGLKVAFLNEYSWKKDKANTDEEMRKIGKEYAEMVVKECAFARGREVRVWTRVEENIQKNKDNHRNRYLANQVLARKLKNR